MATKTIDHLTVQVGVTPYEHDGNKYDALRISVMYSKGYGFYVSWTPVEVTEYGFKTGCVSVTDPLEGGGRVFVERVPKNNAKRLETMRAALQLAQEGIALYFDLRLWTQMNDFIRYVCLYGFTEHYRQQVERLKSLRKESEKNNNNNSNKSEDKTVKSEEVKVKSEELSEQREPSCSHVWPSRDDDRCRQFATAQEARVDNNVTTEADVQEVDDIKPKVVRAAVKAAKGGDATTMPLGKHGTLVIAGVGGTKADGGSKTEDVHQPSAISHQPSTKVQDSVPQVRLVVYTTRHGDQAPRIDGFGGEDDPRWKRHYDEKLRLKKAAKEADKKNEKLKARMKGKSKEERAELLKQWVSVGSDPFNATVRTDFATGDKAYFMLMGAKYMTVAQQLVDAYNSGDAAAIAAAEQAVMDVKNGIVAERQAAREERKSEKLRVKSEESAAAVRTQTSGEKSYTLDEVAAMLGKLLPEVAEKKEELKALLKAA